MSVSFKAIDWNINKNRYDWTLLLIVFSALLGFVGAALYSHPEITAETLMIRGSAIIVALLLHLVLSIGPLTRIDSRFMPLLYNRRHLGVLIFFIACFHALLSIFQFHALGNFPARLSFLTSYAIEIPFWRYNGKLSEIPFEPFGFLSLTILLIMALTSHDFWLKLLGALTWKKIHLLVYLAYFSFIIHVSFGLLQSEQSFVICGLLLLGILWLSFLHAFAFFKNRNSAKIESALEQDGFLFACLYSTLEEGRGKTINIAGKRIAVFLHEKKVKALSNICKHQGGPLGEGRIVDSCVTCPWHGWQYLPDTGCSPPPFKEIVPTYRVRIENDKVFVHPQEIVSS